MLTQSRLRAVAHRAPSAESFLRTWADLYRRRFYQLALFEIRSGVEASKRSPALRYLEAQTLLHLNRPEQAREIFEELRSGSLAPRDFEEHAIRALAENLETALEEVEKAFKTNSKLTGPGEPFAWLEDPSLIGRTGNIVAAVSGGALASSHIPGTLIEPINIFPDRERFFAQVQQQALAQAELLAKQAGSAPPEWEIPEVPSSAPAPGKDKKRFGPLKINREKPAAPVATESPMAAAQVAREQIDGAWEEWTKSFDAYVKDSKFHQALAHVEKAQERFPDRIDLAEYKARMLAELGLDEEAAESLTDAAMTAYQQGRKAEAERLLDSVMSLGRLPARALLPIAAVLTAGGMGAMATRVLRQSVPRLRQENDVEGVREALTQLARLNPGDKAIQADLASVTRKVATLAASAASRQLPPPLRGVAQKAIPKVIPPVAAPVAERSVASKPPAVRPPSNKVETVHPPTIAPPRVLGTPQTGRGAPMQGEDVRILTMDPDNSASPADLAREEMARFAPAALIVFIVGGLAALNGVFIFSAAAAIGLTVLRSKLTKFPSLHMETAVLKVGAIILWIGTAIGFLGLLR